MDEGHSIMCPPLLNIDYSKRSLGGTHEEERWDENDKAKVKSNFKAMHALLCAISEEVFNKVFSCESAKGIWNRLEKVHGDKKTNKDFEKEISTSDEESKDEQTSEIHPSYPKVMCFMALEKQEVYSNSCDFNSYTFNKLQYAFDKLVMEFETMNFKHKKMISKLKVENYFLLKRKMV
ncbi:hypothetical protein V6Z11_D02G094700 [Gossypium hirsutum]